MDGLYSGNALAAIIELNLAEFAMIESPAELLLQETPGRPHYAIGERVRIERDNLCRGAARAGSMAGLRLRRPEQAGQTLHYGPVF